MNELIAVDLNQDGAIDLACVSEDGGMVVLLTNEIDPDSAADLDGDGTVGISDLLILLASWGPNPGHPADLDGDGIVGILDFLQLLGSWGPCA